MVGSHQPPLSIPSMRLPSRAIPVTLLVLAAVQVSLLRAGEGVIDTPAVPTPQVGERIANFGTVTEPGQHRIQRLLGREGIAERIDGHACAVLIFFTASCAALPTLAPAWRDIDTLVVNDVRAPVLWIALQPNDVQADTAYRELGLGGTQLWISYSNEYRKLGIDIVPRAWVVANDLRFYGLAATPAETRELIADCSRSRQRKLTE